MTGAVLGPQSALGKMILPSLILASTRARPPTSDARSHELNTSVRRSGFTVYRHYKWRDGDDSFLTVSCIPSKILGFIETKIQFSSL